MRCCCCCPVGGEPGYPENQRKLDQFKRRQRSSLVPSCVSSRTQGTRHPLYTDMLNQEQLLCCPNRSQLFIIYYNLLSFEIATKYRTTFLMSKGPSACQKRRYAGLSIRSGGQGFPLATLHMASSYFHRKIEEKQNQKKSLTV